MAYGLIVTSTAAALWLVAWLIQRRARFLAFVEESRSSAWLETFDQYTGETAGGSEALARAGSSHFIANDRDHFAEICYQSHVQPELAAQAWVKRALAYNLRR